MRAAEADDLAFAVALAAEAGRVVMERYERLERIRHKGARDVVTEADHLSEELLIRAIRARHPDDGILAEESGEHTGRLAGPVAGGRGRTWVLDPLDGTVNYANGIPFFCVSVALVVDGRPSIGVVHDPTRHETFAASAHGPATLDGRRIQASSKSELSDCVVSLAVAGRSAASTVRAVHRAVRVSRSMGSSALALAYVGNGRFDAMIQVGGLSTWDVAAAGLIAERAGALVTSPDGGPWFDIAAPTAGLGVVAAPARIHGQLLALLGGRRPGP